MSETERPEANEPHEASRDAAGNVGGALGRLVRSARRVARPGPERDRLVEQAHEAVEAARPQAERLAKQAKAAAEAARPHVVRAAREAAAYTREHQDEIKRVAGTGATEFARRAVPPTLRPIANVVEQELRKPSSPRAAGGTPPEAPAEEAAPTDPPSQEQPRS
ncbi:MAG: hypothetical protein Q7K37_01415 [Dehalococcoidia bacterium]|nr:hypothetical protein [Dehalococcoidia bacterium]